MLDRKNKNMNYSFQINCENLNEFIKHWSSKYHYADEYKYNQNIGKPLTERTRKELFEWKNGTIISKIKYDSIIQNYPLSFEGNQEERYLNYRQSGGAIWNIFYLHCLEPAKWPIFDQHTYRAMKYIRTKDIQEIGNTNKQKYKSYLNEYIPFIRSFEGIEHRILDKALFAFGQFLKRTKKFV